MGNLSLSSEAGKVTSEPNTTTWQHIHEGELYVRLKLLSILTGELKKKKDFNHWRCLRIWEPLRTTNQMRSM